MGSGKQGLLRIIAGEWRGRKLRFPAVSGLRPTPDRVRETLFNWLAPDIIDAHCLDLFSGSGALGLEALSRGAAHCHFVDVSRPAIESIKKHLQTLQCTRARCVNMRAEQYLDNEAAADGIDLVFLDPPFGAGLISPVASLLEQHHWLAEGALIYLETARQEPEPELPQNWRLLKEKTAGDVRSRLFTHS